MGNASARPAREAPVRYVAKKLPRLDKTPPELQFKKPNYTAQGINTRQDDVNTEPLMYVETSKDSNSTELTDHAAPRWYMNTYMEMADNVRTDRSIISANLPLSWERDKFEPYSLVKGRIDDEDLKWVLAPEQRSKGVDKILENTKLDRQVLQDILDTVELPRTQYRNYKGKLHKSIEDANTYAAARKVQMEKAREAEVLREIGYTDEEIANDQQYLTKRSRGVKTLDDLGATQRQMQRQERATQNQEMEEMLERRRTEQIEKGVYEPSEEELLARPLDRSTNKKSRTQTFKQMYAADMGKDEESVQKIHWWLDRRRRVARTKDTIYGVPVYNERLTSNEEQRRQQMKEAAEFNFSLAQAQGAKGFSDPRAHYEQMVNAYRYNKENPIDEDLVDVHEDGSGEHIVHRYTRSGKVEPDPPSSSEAPSGAPLNAHSNSKTTPNNDDDSKK